MTGERRNKVGRAKGGWTFFRYEIKVFSAGKRPGKRKQVDFGKAELRNTYQSANAGRQTGITDWKDGALSSVGLIRFDIFRQMLRCMRGTTVFPRSVTVPCTGGSTGIRQNKRKNTGHQNQYRSFHAFHAIPPFLNDSYYHINNNYAHFQKNNISMYGNIIIAFSFRIVLSGEQKIVSCR